MQVSNSQSSWFGYGDFIHSNGAYYSNTSYGYYWTTDYDGNYYVNSFHVNVGGSLSIMSPTDAYPVRCMKDE